MSKAKHSIKVPTQYKVAAKVLKQAIELKKPIISLILEQKHARTKSLKAVLAEYSNNREAIDNAIEQTGLLKDNPGLDSALAKVLVTELTFGRGDLTGRDCKPVQTVLAYKERLQQALSATEEPKKEPHPRYVRINTNLVSIADALDYLYSEEWRQKQLPADAKYADFLAAVRQLEEDEFLMDINVEGLLVFHHQHDRYWVTHEYVASKKFILQNKGTSLAAELLAPPAGSTVLDMCAAPGMKTVHICNVMRNQGQIYAVELNADRFSALRNITEEAGCKIVKSFNMDAFDSDSTQFPDVEYILVDPSCSGSGMQKRMVVTDEPKDIFRISKLATLQTKMLCHAMTSFPNVKRIVYCTCSVWKEENEEVVSRCLKWNPSFKLLSGKKALRNKWQNVGDKDFGEIGKKCLSCVPEHDLTDGIFLALFEKRKENE